MIMCIRHALCGMLFIPLIKVLIYVLLNKDRQICD
jgi:hypothetical protein